MTAVSLTYSWDAETVVLSYVIAVTGSFCTIQIMEQWRVQDHAQQKRLLLLFSSIALGGCGIWAMHFTGMQAQHLRLADGSEIHIDFEGGMTILSLLFPIAGVFIGLTIASRDPFFLEIEHSRRKAIVADQIKTMSITEMLNRGAVQRKIKFIALFSRLWRILLGGLWAALGVLGMHYLGMMAQRSPLTMTFAVGYVVASCIIAFVAATAAFWIIFRALTFWPSVDSLRIGSALVMGVAVCGTHYTGMAAAGYEVDASLLSSHQHPGFIMGGQVAFRVASNGSLALCFWLVSLSVVRDLRVSVASARTHSQPVTNSNQSAKAAADQGTVVPFHNTSVPRNVVQPAKNTVVARLATKQQRASPTAEQPDEGPGATATAWGVVPGRI